MNSDEENPEIFDFAHHTSMVRDTQIYYGQYEVSGGNETDSDLDLTIDGDSEPLEDSSSESDDSDDAPMIVSKTDSLKKKNAKPEKKMKADSDISTGHINGVSGGGVVTFSDLSREFISYLGSVKLPI